jgi:hypothetical protein
LIAEIGGLLLQAIRLDICRILYCRRSLIRLAARGIGLLLLGRALASRRKSKNGKSQ